MAIYTNLLPATAILVYFTYIRICNFDGILYNHIIIVAVSRLQYYDACHRFHSEIMFCTCRNNNDAAAQTWKCV